MTDALTGLPTHRDGLRGSILSRSSACCLVDIDGLIWVNDQYGHGEGDRVLVRIAEYLLQCAAKRQASVYRVGGDEFLVLLPSPAGRFEATGFAKEFVSGVRALEIPYRRVDRPDRTFLEVNVASLRVDAAFAARAFSEFGFTRAVQDWIAGAIFEEKKRVGRAVGIVVDLFDAPGAPWVAPLSR